MFHVCLFQTTDETRVEDGLIKRALHFHLERKGNGLGEGWNDAVTKINELLSSYLTPNNKVFLDCHECLMKDPVFILALSMGKCK